MLFLQKLKNSYIFYRRSVYLKTKIIKSASVMVFSVWNCSTSFRGSVAEWNDPV